MNASLANLAGASSRKKAVEARRVKEDEARATAVRFSIVIVSLDREGSSLTTYWSESI